MGQSEASSGENSEQRHTYRQGAGSEKPSVDGHRRCGALPRGCRARDQADGTVAALGHRGEQYLDSGGGVSHVRCGTGGRRGDSAA